MDRVQVVLGEAERADGLLRLVLEDEGFDILRVAADDRELARVLRSCRPSVIVLDGGISALAALRAREASSAPLVVVWPDGVAAALAEERVDPRLIMEDLGDAVRRASVRAESPDAALAPGATRQRLPVEADRPGTARRGRRRRDLLVAAAVWLVALTALATIAAAVPTALEVITGQGRPRSSLQAPQGSQTPQRRGREQDVVDTASGPVVQRGLPATCGTFDAAVDRPDPALGRALADPARARGCPPNRGGGEAGGGGGDRGRPQDPADRGKANGPPQQPPAQPPVDTETNLVGGEQQETDGRGGGDDGVGAGRRSEHATVGGTTTAR